MILTPPNKNLIAQAHNGSGKTTCFVLGMLSRVAPKLTAPQALCICPTRELAIQNMEVLLKMGKFTGITSELAIPADPANYIPIQKRPPITAQSGFRDDSVREMKESNCKSSIQLPAQQLSCSKRLRTIKVLLFSATFDDAVRAFVSKIVEEIFVRDYNQMFVKKEELSLESVKQYKVHCPDELSKIMVIKDRILELGEKVGQTIIFVRSRNSAAMLHKSLVSLGYEVTTIQGALKQEDRDKIIKEFKEGLTQVLISTDLLARGFDQKQVNLVVNFDLPVRYDRPTEPDYEVYLHRVGRAGRFGRKVYEVLNTIGVLEMKMFLLTTVYPLNVAPWNSEKEFEVALENAGLLLLVVLSYMRGVIIQRLISVFTVSSHTEYSSHIPLRPKMLCSACMLSGAHSFTLGNGGEILIRTIARQQDHNVLRRKSSSPSYICQVSDPCDRCLPAYFEFTLISADG
ncbi:DEAD-box ATP-dependent RNA helicase 38 [Sesamum angolense]|uniref:RNA helicase n=1 Tax=Sesamum angolense TaxID=2727404 RepID=A0AAE1WNM6_9LAMI|nr:DEAD-box ATP-dependent RNA helicase 38 [Sesamum angolense]